METVVEFFIKENGRHPLNDPIGRKYKYNPQELMEFAERYAEYKQRQEPVSLKRFVSRRKAKKMRKDAITTLELTKGITGERDNTLKTMEEMANNVIELTSAY